MVERVPKAACEVGRFFAKFEIEMDDTFRSPTICLPVSECYKCVCVILFGKFFRFIVKLRYVKDERTAALVQSFVRSKVM